MKHHSDESRGAVAQAARTHAALQRTHRVDVRGLESDLKARVDGEVRFDAQTKALYSTDGSNYRQVPIGVVVPRNKDAVIEAVAVCREHGAPILSRGCGTSLAGQCCNVAVVIDHSKYLTRILDIDAGAKTATVEPGVILDHLRNRAQHGHTLTYGPDPATHNHCTLGGMIGNNSCGIHSVMAGRTADNVEELEILTYDGVRMHVGPTNDDELDRIIAAGGRRAEIYETMKEIRDENTDRIRDRYPEIPRRVSGYNLDDLLPENDFNVAKALVGTESTCVTILEARVRLVHSPPQRTLLVLGYPDVYSAADQVMEIMECGPLGLEGIDDKLVHFMKLKGLHPRDVQLLPDGGGWLLTEFGGDSKEESDDRARECMERLKNRSDVPSMKLFTDIAEEKLIWEVRESGLGATADVPTFPLAWPGREDAAIHPEKEGSYLREFRSLLDKYGYIASLYGHFGQGCIHCRISFDLFTRDGVRKYMSFIDEASDLVLKHGGSFSGEHGDGQSRAIFLPKMYGPEIMEAFHRFKTAWDPDWRMNPGKVIDPYRPDQNLRLGEHYKPRQPPTHFQFPEDEGSFSRATLRCVGVGKCRKTEDAFMCPSFLVTHEERDTTRGRAHLLFEMFHGGVIDSGWRSKEVLDALDLCLACKGCKKECPVDVDIAAYKAEFLSHHYHHRLRPRHAYLMGLIGFWGLLGSKAPRLANVFSQTPGLSTIAKAVGGIAQQRRLPKFAVQTFRQWYARNRGRRSTTGQQVALYTDPFNDYFYPHTLQATYMVLKHWGYDVVIPPGRVTSPRPLIHYGWLRLAEREIRTTLRQLSSFVAAGIPVIFCEPSTASVFRDEVPSLLPTDRDGQRLTQLACLFSEFIEREHIQVPKLGGKAVFHGHCHQKAVLNPEAARNLLKKMDVDFEEPQQTCCGMAGSFGFEAPHYEVSMKIAELGLFPAIRRAPERTYIVADGFSCRTQIEEGTGRQALHMGELILTALERNGELSP